MRLAVNAEVAVSTAPETIRVRTSATPPPHGTRAASTNVPAGDPGETAGRGIGVRPLTEVPLRAAARVVALAVPDEAHDPEIVARLGELGFLPGETVRVIARAFMGDPLAVRIGTGTFALRRAEARCIRVRLED